MPKNAEPMMGAGPSDIAMIVVRKGYLDSAPGRHWDSGCPMNPARPAAAPVRVWETACRQVEEVSPSFVQENRRARPSLVPNSREARRKISRFRCRSRERVQRPVLQHPVRTLRTRLRQPEAEAAFYGPAS